MMGLIKNSDDALLIHMTKAFLATTKLFERFNLKAVTQNDIDVTVIPVYYPDTQATTAEDYIGKARHGGYRCLVSSSQQGSAADRIEYIDFTPAGPATTLQAIVQKRTCDEHGLRDAMDFAETLARSKPGDYEPRLIENTAIGLHAVWLAGQDNILIPFDVKNVTLPCIAGLLRLQ
jgi:hypothetical protein